MGHMERKTSESGYEYLDLGEEYRRFELGGLSAAPAALIFAIKGEFPLGKDASDQYKQKLIAEVITYFAATYPEIELDNTRLSEETYIVYVGKFPDDKSADVATQNANRDIVFIDRNTREGAEALDWFDGAPQILIFE